MNFFEDEENQLIIVLDNTEFPLETEYASLFQRYTENKEALRVEMAAGVSEALQLLQEHWNSYTNKNEAVKQRYFKLVAKIGTLESEL